MVKTNEKRLVEFTLECKPGHPFAGRTISVDHRGEPFQLPGIGGITLNVEMGDSAFGWEGDHIEPGVSCRWGVDKPMENRNQALQILACVGNRATVMSGKAAGRKGVVIGHHGGSEHVIVDFDRKTKRWLGYDDKIAIHAIGMGLKLKKYPGIKATNLSPKLLKKMKIRPGKGGRLLAPVTTLVPSECMGSGIGKSQVSSGDYDIMTSDPKTVKKYALDRIRFGDFVALLDQDNRFGRAHRKGAVTIGIVVHSDCKYAGHGPGVSTLLTCTGGEIVPVLSPKANIAELMKVGRSRK